MKKLFILLVVVFSIQISYAQKGRFAFGIYACVSHQNVNYIHGADFMKPKGLSFSSSEIGVLFNYALNETFSLNLGVGKGQTHVLLNDDFISTFQYDKLPVSLSVRSDLFDKSGFSVFIENGVRGIYCDSYSYNQLINPDKQGYVLYGQVGPYEVAENFSYGLINGLGVSYAFDFGLEIDFAMRYYSGLGKLWENNLILVKTIDDHMMYSMSSFGSSLDLGMTCCYRF